MGHNRGTITVNKKYGRDLSNKEIKSPKGDTKYEKIEGRMNEERNCCQIVPKTKS